MKVIRFIHRKRKPDKEQRLSDRYWKTELREYITYVKNPRKMFIPNLIGGIARGIGMGIGFSLLTAILIILLQYLIQINLPGISEFIARIVKMVDIYR